MVDGAPARLKVDLEKIQLELDRRRPGQSRLTTQRDEADQVEILSGVSDGFATGAPIAMMVRNKDARSGAYTHLQDLYRPSHADFTYDQKYGHRTIAGGGRSSARETIGRVAAGALAVGLLEQLAQQHGRPVPEIVSWVSQVHVIDSDVDPKTVDRDAVEMDPTRCPDPDAAVRMTLSLIHI